MKTVKVLQNFLNLLILFFLVDFADLFPDRDIMFGDFTIITISQKTKEDMTGWSEDVEVEREELLKTVCAKMGLITRKNVFGVLDKGR